MFAYKFLAPLVPTEMSETVALSDQRCVMSYTAYAGMVFLGV